MTDYRPRALAPVVRHALTQMPVVVVTGLRQSGKSTFLQNETGLRDRLYRTLDDLNQLEAARRAPEAYVESSDPMTIDEAQRCPELVLAIKRAVDRDRRAGRFLLSGSANFSLLKQMSESLAGRAIYFVLPPLTRRELATGGMPAPFLKRLLDSGLAGKPAGVPAITAEDVLLGGLPPVRLRLVPDYGLWFQGYEQTYLQRDVRDLSPLTDLVGFRQVMQLAAHRTGQLLNISELARDAKQNAMTTSRYLGLLETSFVVQRLPPFLSNPATRLIKSPKLYVTDSGLACHMLGLPDAQAFVGDGRWGRLLETYVAQNLMGILQSEWPDAHLSYWHIQGRHEVDFVIESRRGVLALEVKANRRWSERDLAGLQAFQRDTPRCRVAVVAYAGEEIVQLGEKLWAIPLEVALS
jgi:predicted AAA+ superfamily ATPase